MTQVSLAGVSKIYPPNVQAVRSVDLEVHDGELLVLVGPSGCGKSTTLRLVAGLEEVSAGVIRFGAEEVTHLPPSRRNVAMVFQEDALWPHLNVRENLAFHWRLRRGWLSRLWRMKLWRTKQCKQNVPTDTKQGDIDQRINEAARMLGIERLLDRYPWQLSGGEKQRVALGRAIVRTPNVLLLDEPLSNLDWQLREEMRAELAQLHRRMGVTTIYVTHDQVEAMTLGERIAVMDQGSIQQTGRPLEVYDRPINRRVAGMLGSPPMNFIDGKLVATDGGMRFVGSGLQVKFLHQQAARLQEHASRRVVLGVRPEHVRVQTGEAAQPRETSLAKIAMVETLGDSTILRLRLEYEGKGDETESSSIVTCKREGRFNGALSQRVTIQLTSTECHVFDAEDGRNLTI